MDFIWILRPEKKKELSNNQPMHNLEVCPTFYSCQHDSAGNPAHTNSVFKESKHKAGVTGSEIMDHLMVCSI